MIGNFHKFFNKHSSKSGGYAYESEYDDIDDDAEDYFMEESYMDSNDTEDEFFD